MCVRPSKKASLTTSICSAGRSCTSSGKRPASRLSARDSLSNFISGIIILLDRSIKPGDTISLGETFGWIRELRARFVSVITRDGREYLIPNEDFITHEVINWSFTDSLVRLDVEFGVSYEANPHEVSEIAVEGASRCLRVYRGKRPVFWLTCFGY